MENIKHVSVNPKRGIPGLRPKDGKELTRVPSGGGHASCSLRTEYMGVRMWGASVQVPMGRNSHPARRAKGNTGRNGCRGESIWMWEHCVNSHSGLALATGPWSHAKIWKTRLRSQEASLKGLALGVVDKWRMSCITPRQRDMMSSS